MSGRIRGVFAENPVALGVLFGICQSFCAVLMGLLIKLASPEHHFVDAMFYRNFVSALVLLAVIWFQGELSKIPKANKKRQLVRGMLGTYGMVFTFAAYVYLPLTEVQSLLFTAPLFVVVLSYPLLKEKVGVYRGLATLVGFCGVMLILQPGGISSAMGGIIGLLAATGHAAVMILLRYLGRSEEPYVTAFYFSAISTVLVLPFMPFYASMPSAYTFLVLVMIGFVAAALQICLTKAYFLAPASIIAPVTYTSMIWAMLFDFFLWGYLPSTMIVLGAVIIISANFLIFYREARLKKKSPVIEP